MAHKKFEAHNSIRGLLKPQRMDKLDNLMFNDVLESQPRFRARVMPKFTFKAWIQKMYPRFGVTHAQKQYNYFRQIKWNSEPITIYLDDFEIAEDV